MFEFLKRKIIDWCLSRKSTSIKKLLETYQLANSSIAGPDGNLKFTGMAKTDDLYVETDIGFSKVKQILKTVPYRAYKLHLESGDELIAADEHLVILKDGTEKAICDLTTKDRVKTINGDSQVRSISELTYAEPMYDLELEGDHHTYYTNNILSHNTQTISMYLLWFAMFHDDKTVVIASKNNGHAMEIMDRIRFAYEEMPHWIKAGCKYYNKHNLEFDNGSRIKSEATTEKTGRGLAISKLYLDELAFISHRIQTAMWRSLAPTLSTGGEFIISSTPNGDTDLFATLWREANKDKAESETEVEDASQPIKKNKNAFVPVFYPWNRHPDRGEEYLKEMRQELGPEGFAQEVMCQFISSDAMLLDSLKLSYLRSKPPVTSSMGFKFWTTNIGGRGKTYLVGLDPSTGNGKDFTVIEVFEFPKLEQVAELRLNSVSIPLIYAKLKWLFKQLRRPDAGKGRAEVLWSFERNGVGEALVAMIQNDDSPDGGVYIDGVELYNENPLRLGCYTSGKSKLLACMQMKNLIEKGAAGLKINSEMMLYELQNYVSAAGSFQAKPGCTDDTISALTIIIKVLSRLASYDDRARKVVYESVDPDSDNDDLDPETPQDQYGDQPVPIFI
jgi:hypothetical protein